MSLKYEPACSAEKAGTGLVAWVMGVGFIVWGTVIQKQQKCEAVPRRARI